MPLRTPLVAASVALASFACSPTPDPPSGDGAIAFVGVTVIPMDAERVETDQTVVVRDGGIAALGPRDSIPVPPGARSIDGRGKYLIPALAEMHAHLPDDDAATDEMVERVLFLYVANGIGTIRNMQGHPRHLPLRARVSRGELIGPRIVTSGPSLNGESVPTEEEAERLVTEHAEAGYDLLKIHPRIKREVFETLAATAAREGIRFAGHIPAEVGLTRALELGYATIDHLDGYLEALVRPGAPVDPKETQLFGLNLVAHVDESRMPELAAATRSAGAWVVPTQILLENWVDDEDPRAMAERPEMRYARPGEVDEWIKSKQARLTAVPAADRRRFLELRRRLIKVLHEGGVGLLLGSDAPQVWNVPGFSMHRELQALVDAGLTPYQALETGTRNVAVYLQTIDTAGTIEEGKAADLLLLDANPLTDIANASRSAGVMLAGRWIPKSDIDERLAALTAGS